jgi:hypothetical protein
MIDAAVAVFAERGSHPMPVYLPEPPEQWKVPYARLAAELGLQSDLLQGYREARVFVDPVLSGRRFGGHWDPAHRAWLG